MAAHRGDKAEVIEAARLKNMRRDSGFLAALFEWRAFEYHEFDFSAQRSLAFCHHQGVGFEARKTWTRANMQDFQS
jgi:hypothetical protein